MATFGLRPNVGASGSEEDREEPKDLYAGQCRVAACRVLISITLISMLKGIAVPADRMRAKDVLGCSGGF